MDKRQKNILISKIIIFILVILGGGYLIWQWYNYNTILKEQIITNFKDNLILETNNIDYELIKQKNNLDKLFNVFKSKSFTEYEEGLIKKTDPNFLNFINNTSNYFNIENIYIFDKNNKLSCSYPDSNIVPDKSLLTRVMAITKPNDIITFYSNNNFDAKKYLMYVFITLSEKQDVTGKLVIIVNMGKNYQKLLTYKSKYLENNNIYLIKKNENDIFFISQLKNFEYNTINLPTSNFDGGEIIEYVNSGKYGIAIGTDYKKTRVLAYIYFNNKTNWILVNSVRYDEIEFAYKKEFLKYMAVNLFVLVVISALLILLYKKYSDYFIKVEKQNLDFELLVNRLRRGEQIAKVGYWEVDLTTKSVFSSLGARELYGIDKEDLTLSDIQKVPLPEYRKMLDEALDKMLRFNAKYEVEFKIRNNKDYTIRDIYSYAIFDKTQNKIFGVIKDITEENKIKKKLAEAEERLRYAVEAGNYGVWDLDLNTGEYYWNENSYKLLGYKPNEIKMTFETIQQLMHPDDLKKIYATLEKLNNNAVTEFSHEFRLRHKSGNYRWILGKGKVAGYNENGKPTRLVGINLDIDEKKQAELELKKIEWMLIRQSVVEEEDKFKRNLIIKSNSKGLIFESVNRDVLQGIMYDYLHLLGTSSIIFEQDGSYALGIFQGDWCINLHESKKLRNNKFTNTYCSICYYNEWEMCGKVAITKKEIVKHKCEAGIEIFAVPIFTFGQVIGSVSVALTAPTENTYELEDIAHLYNLPNMLLKKIAVSYDIRPNYIIELAKERIKNAAKLIGTLVEKSITEKDLKRNRELYKNLIESSDSIIVLIDSSYNILYANHVAAQYFEYDPNHLVGLNLSELFEGLDQNDLERYVSKVIEGEKKVSEIITLNIKDEKKTFRTNIFPVKNNEGRIYSALVNANDITELIESENQKRKTEEMFYSLLDYFVGGVFIKNRKGITLYVNKYLKELFDAEKWIGKNALESFPGEIGERLFIDDMNTFELGYQKIIETIPCKDGIERFYETHKFVIEREGEDPLLGGLTFDVTSLINAQKSLNEIKIQQERILNSLPDIIFELNNKFDIIWINTFAEKYFGKEILGKNINLLVKGIEEELKLYWGNNIDKVYYYENTININNEDKYFSWWFKAEINEKRELINIIVAGRDITDKKLYENEILKINASLDLKVKERTAELEAANKELEAFTYSVSHDLRSPLRAIDGFSRIILEDYSQILDDEGRRLFNVIRHNAKKMDQLITDLLQLSRVTRQQIEKETIDMTQFLKEIYEETANDDIKYKFQFICNKLEDARADKKLLRQVWINLISNAIKYTLPKGNKVIEVSSYKEGNEIVYKIQDTGVGFNQEYSNKLFGVFQRLHRTEEFEGTGVGLALVKRIIDKHGGRVWAEGKINEGATFYVALPK